MKKEEYKKLRDKYKSENLRGIFIAESPPKSGKFFYNEKGFINEDLFSAMMKFINEQPKTKREGLSAFKNKGYFLIDSIYEPVNKIKPEREKNRKILGNINGLIADLDKIVNGSRIKVVLIKNSIHQILYGPLTAIGYKVINKEPIPFPSRSQKNINSFLTKLRKLKI